MAKETTSLLGRIDNVGLSRKIRELSRLPIIWQPRITKIEGGEVRISSLFESPNASTCSNVHLFHPRVSDDVV